MEFSRLLPSPILQAAHGVRKPIPTSPALFRLRESVGATGVFSDDSGDHEYREINEGAPEQGFGPSGVVSNHLKSA